jgi:hypothetical protein
LSPYGVVIHVAHPPFSNKIGLKNAQLLGSARLHSENTIPTGGAPTKLL